MDCRHIRRSQAGGDLDPDGTSCQGQAFRRPRGRERRCIMSAANPVTLPLADYRAQHLRVAIDHKVATLTLNRPERKNPLTFASYAELVDIFRALPRDKDVKAVVVTGEGGNFCSGGDVFEIIGPPL